MDEYEMSVLRCLTANGETFVANEYPVGSGDSRPDFVALRPGKKTVYIVEVSAGGGLAKLVKRVIARKELWIAQLRAELLRLAVVDESWRYQVLVFIQEEQIEWFQKKIGDPQDVTVLSLEQAIVHWKWDASVWTPNFSFEAGTLERTA